MKSVVRRLIRSHPVVYQTASRLYLAVERPYRRYRQGRQLAPEQARVRAVLAPAAARARVAGPRVLFVSTRGLYNHQLIDGFIGHGLRLRGADVRFFTCGGGLPLCDFTNVHDGLTPLHCDYCRDCCVKTIRSFGNRPPLTLRDLLSDAEIASWHAAASRSGEPGGPALPADPETCEYRGVPIGRLVGVSLRYILCRSTLPQTEEIRGYHRRMTASACMLVDAFERLLDRERPDRLFIFNGLGFPEAVMRCLATGRGIPVTTYEAGIRPDTVLLAHDAPAGWMDLDTEWPRVRDLPLAPEQEEQLDAYLAGRWQGGGGLEWIWPTMQADQSRIRERLRLPDGARCVSLFTNIVWDTGALDRDRAYPGMMEWIRATVDFFGARRPDDYLLVRVHPAEARWCSPTMEPVVDAIERGGIPPNVRVIRPEEDISSYELVRMSELGLVYTSTIGMEMGLMGRTCLVAGRTHYEHKGFTTSFETTEEYERLLSPGVLPARIDEQARELARRYAYTLWFRHHLDFPWVSAPGPARTVLRLDDPDELRPDGHADFDLLCKAVLTGRSILDLRLEAERSRAAAVVR